ncbi:PREDICTED: zinc finger protein 184-like [Vollenhovia emeryi]|uniref:zinc finger protein 184-like n=1 Tax=Vollenhovia emeryi TaxID=411798 RepID=UPI0005F5750B|nr:PREDICTED: zinc finger protein 184-like [Vollenhovia emeryi]
MNAGLYTMAAADGKWDMVCRLCSQVRNEMLPIFGDEGQQRRVAQKLRACLPVLVYESDPLPKQICQFCAARLDDAYEFREFCLSVYKSMHAVLLTCKQTESTQIFLDSMRNSPDPCQVQLCREKSRAPPPLVPLSAALPFDDSAMPIGQAGQEHLQAACLDTLPELPCEVEIEEMNADPILSAETAVCEPSGRKRRLPEPFGVDAQTKAESVLVADAEGARAPKLDYQAKREEKRTSILEQVLTGSLTMNNHQQLQPRTRLTSEWWCAPCNSYYKTKDSLMKHMQLHCPRVYTCRKCSASFDSVEFLAKHEAKNHLKIDLDLIENLNDCDQCERQFVSWEMLKQHRLRDHLAESAKIGSNTWCSLCNRFFRTVESYQGHVQLHQTRWIVSPKLPSSEPTVAKIAERPREIKRDEQYYENVRSLMCPTCGKICTQQSALSNHMRTHEPKKFKCNICGRSFGLLIRLAGHRITEHNEQTMMSPALSAVEQEEALNAEREAREAREAKTRGTKRPYSEVMEKSDAPVDDESPTKRTTGGHKNVARCGICLQWFSDHTTMLTHLQTHSDNYTHKSYVCQICKKTFREQSQLSKHEACHKRLTLDNASLPYTPAVFNKSFMDKAHQKIHIVRKTYHCDKCNKIFFKEVSLLAHECTGGAPLEKKVAAKSRQKSSSHVVGDKSYKCSKCDAIFASSQSRNAHMKMHAEYMRGSTAQTHEVKVEADDEPMPKLRPETLLEYVSPIEPKVEIDEQSAPPLPLKRTLINTTSGFRCGVCSSPFVSRELAVAHLRSAHPKMPYQCPYCKKHFTTQFKFSCHIKRDHPDEPEK